MRRGFLQVVTCHVGELLKLTGFRLNGEFFVLAADFLLAPLPLGDVGNHPDNEQDAPVVIGDAGGALFEPGELAGIGAPEAELSAIRAAVAGDMFQSGPVAGLIFGVNETQTFGRAAQRGAEDPVSVAEAGDLVLAGSHCRGHHGVLLEGEPKPHFTDPARPDRLPRACGPGTGEPRRGPVIRARP